MQHVVAPRHLQEVQDLAHPLLRAGHQLLVVDSEAAMLDGLAVAHHPLRHLVPEESGRHEVLGVHAGDGDVSGDYGVGHSPPVPQQQDEPGLRKQSEDVVHVVEHQRVLVAEVLGRFAVVEDDLSDERPGGVVQGLVAQPGRHEPLVLPLRLVPAVPHPDDAGDDPGLLPAADLRVGVQHGPGQRGTAPGHSTHKDHLQYA